MSHLRFLSTVYVLVDNRDLTNLDNPDPSLLWGALDLRHVFRSKKVLVFNAMEDITNDEYLARS